MTRGLKAVLIALLLCLGSAAVAAGVPVSPRTTQARAEAGSVREQMNAIRREQSEKRAALGQLSARITELKQQPRRRLRNSELEAALQQSQLLSTELSGLARRMATLERSSEAAHTAIADALSAEI